MVKRGLACDRKVMEKCEQIQQRVLHFLQLYRFFE